MCMTSVVHPQPAQDYEGLICSVYIILHKARIKLENAVYLPLNTTCWIFKTIMYAKSLTQNYLYICKPETGAAFQPKPKFSAEHLSNFISNHLNVHKCDGTKMKSVCPFCCFYVLTCEFNIYRHRYKTGRLICQIGQKFIQIPIHIHIHWTPPTYQ